LSEALAKLASINLWKLVLSPTGSINLGFILREDLLLCSSYLPLGVPNWAVIYTPSADRGKDNIISTPPNPDSTNSKAGLKVDRSHRNHPPQIHRSERTLGQQLTGAATSGLAEMGIEL
jgi:hypothetical protein